MIPIVVLFSALLVPGAADGEPHCDRPSGDGGDGHPAWCDPPCRAFVQAWVARAGVFVCIERGPAASSDLGWSSA